MAKKWLQKKPVFRKKQLLIFFLISAAENGIIHLNIIMLQDYYDVRACLICCRLFRHFGFDLKKDEKKIECFFNAFTDAWSGYFDKGWVREFKEALEYYKNITETETTAWVEYINGTGDVVKLFHHEYAMPEFINSPEYEYFKKTNKLQFSVIEKKKYNW